MRESLQGLSVKRRDENAEALKTILLVSALSVPTRAATLSDALCNQGGIEPQISRKGKLDAKFYLLQCS